LADPVRAVPGQLHPPCAGSNHRAEPLADHHDRRRFAAGTAGRLPRGGGLALVAETARIMQGRLLLNVLLLACAALLGGWIYRSGSGPADQRLAAIDVQTVQRIEIVRADAEPLVLERTGAGWQLAKPRAL